MLQIKQKHHLGLPQITLFPPIMDFSPIIDEDDELLVDIAADQTSPDDNWRLTERPDGEELTQFWGTVETDVQNDPDWIRFSED